MIGSGDIQNQTEKLKKLLARVNFPDKITFQSLVNNNPFVFLTILHHSVIDYNQNFYRQLLTKDYELLSKKDLRFVEVIYKILLKEFGYKPPITPGQFLSAQFLEQKIILVNDLIEFVLAQDAEPAKRKASSKQRIESIGGGSSVCALNYGNNADDDVEAVQQSLSELPQQQRLDEQAFTLEPNSLAEPKRRGQKKPSIVKRTLSKDKLQHLQDLQAEQVPVLAQEARTDFNKENLQQNLLQPEVARSQQPRAPSDDPKKCAHCEHGKAETQQIMGLILEMNSSIQMVVKKFDQHQSSVEKWVSNTSAQMILLENQVKFLKQQLANQQQQQQLQQLPAERTL